MLAQHQASHPEIFSKIFLVIPNLVAQSIQILYLPTNYFFMIFYIRHPPVISAHIAAVHSTMAHWEHTEI